jgi:hypothetical protein
MTYHEVAGDAWFVDRRQWTANGRQHYYVRGVLKCEDESQYRLAQLQSLWPEIFFGYFVCLCVPEA